MLKKRIIPCLDVKNGRTVKGVNFVSLRDAGDPVQLAKQYVQQGADELVFLDISATQEERATLIPLVKHIAKEVSIPFTVGGGISSVEQARKIILAGAEKVAINSAAVKHPSLISDISSEFGSQSVVVAIDVKQTELQWEVFIAGGTVSTGLNAIQWAKETEQLGAGEILLTSMDHDGTKNGFAIDLLNAITNAVSIPVIASGGAGHQNHFLQVFSTTDASAALAASVFHFGEIQLPELKQFLKEQNLPIR